MRGAATPTTGEILGTGPAAKTLKRIRAFINRFESVRPQREKFARALGLDWTNHASRRPANDPENFERHSVNWTFFYGQLLKSAASGEPPVIKYPRDAGEGQSATGLPAPVPGDSELAPYVEILINRMVKQARATESWAESIDDILAWGSGCVAIGFSKSVAHPDVAEAVLRPVNEIARSALMGEVEAKAGERHEEAAEHLRAMIDKALDAEDTFDLSPEEMRAFAQRAESHDRMAIKEAREPLPPAWDGHRVWARRLQPGVDVFWDASVTRLEDTAFRARRVEMTLEEFKASTLFSRAARERIKGVSLRGSTGLETSEARDSDRQQDGDYDGEDRVVILYEVWIKKPNMLAGGERRFVSPEAPDLFLERDSRNPYTDPNTGKPLIPGFWPIFICTPLMPPVNDPIRTLGTPAAAPGWPQQVEANALRALSLESARKHSKTVYVVDPRVGSRAKVQKILDGPDAAVFFAPPGVKDAGERKSLVLPIQFTGNNEELDRQFVRVEQDWRQVMGVAAAVFAGQGVSDTLGQDELAAQAGRNLQGLIIKSVETSFADMVEGIRGLAKRLPREVVVRMLGTRGADVVDAWRPTALDGDRMWVRFGSTAAAQERVDRKQLMETIAILEQKQEGGLPIFDTKPYYADLTRSQKLGDPKELDPEHKRLLQMAMQFQMLMEKVGPQGIEALMSGGATSSGGGGGSPVKSDQNDPRGPSNANIGAGARRGAGTVNN